MPPRARKTTPTEPELTVPLPQFREPTPPESPNVQREPVNPESRMSPPAAAQNLRDRMKMSLLQGKLGEAVANASPFDPSATLGTHTEKPVRERVAIDPETALKAGLAIVGVLVVTASWMARSRFRRSVRKPTDSQREAVAKPLAEILGRHLDIGRVAPDIVNLAEISIGVNDYVSDGPILQGPRIDVGVPEDLQEKE